VARLRDYDAWLACKELVQTTVVGDRSVYLLRHDTDHAHCIRLTPLFERLVGTPGCEVRVGDDVEQSARLEAIMDEREITASPTPPSSPPDEPIWLKCLEGSLDVERARGFLLDIDGAFEGRQDDILLAEGSEAEVVYERLGFLSCATIQVHPDGVLLNLEGCRHEVLGRVRLFLDWLLENHALGEERRGPLGVVTDHLLPRVPTDPAWIRPRFESLADADDERAYSQLESREIRVVELGLDHLRQPSRARVAAALCRGSFLDDGELRPGPYLEELPREAYVTLALFTLANPELAAGATALKIDAAGGFGELPRELGRWTALERLELSVFEGATLPAPVLELTALKELVLDCWQLDTLPPELTRLKSLERLDLASTGVSFEALEQLVPILRELPRLAAIRVSWSPTSSQRATLSSKQGLPGVKIE